MADPFHDGGQNVLDVLRQELNGLRIVELKNVLEQLQLSRSGNKADLVERLTHNVQVLHQLQRRAERDHAIKAVRDEVMRFRGYSQLPVTAGGGATVNMGAGAGHHHSHHHAHGGGGSGSGVGYMSSASSMAARLGLGGVKPETAVGAGASAGAASLAHLGRSRPAGAGAGGAGSSGAPVQCICGQGSSSWDEVVCTGCQKAFHAQCYGNTMKLRNQNHPALCFLCLSLRQNPFFKVEDTLMLPTRVGSRQGYEYSFSFRLTMQQQREAMESRQRAGGARAHTLLVAVRCFPLDLFEVTKGRVQDLTRPPFYPPHCWPLESVLRVNREYVHLKQRQVYYHGTQRKWKGGSEPVDVYHNSRVGPNLLSLQHKDEGKTYVLVVQLVRVVPVPDLFQRIRAYPDTPSIAASLERIKESFRVTCIDSDDEGDGGGGGGAVATVTRLSLRCPLGLIPIETPARGKDCQHLQCFDLNTFLAYNEKGSSAGWKCGVCNRTLTVEELRVDAFMQDVLRQIEARKMANEDLDSVQIDREGNWKLFSAAAAAASRKRKADEARAEAIDDDDIEDLDRKPPAPTSNSSTGAGGGTASASTASSAAPRRPSASMPIDLTLSSDEEDNTVPTSRLAPSAPAPAPPARATSATGPSSTMAPRAAAATAFVELVDDDPLPMPLPPPPAPAVAPAAPPPPPPPSATSAATIPPAIPPYRPNIINSAARYGIAPPAPSAAAMSHHALQQQREQLNAMIAESLGYGGLGGGGAGLGFGSFGLG